MELSNNQIIIAVIANVFNTYIIYRLMHVFFPQGSPRKLQEMLSYGLYFVMNNVVYLVIGDPHILVSTNIILYGIISMQYDGRWTKRVVAVALTLGLNAIAEVCVTLGMNALGYGEPWHYDDQAYLIGQLAIQIISYIIVLICINIKRSRQDIELPLMYWCAIILVPLSTLVISITFSMVMTSQYITLMIICAVMMCGLNIMIFYLYDRLQEVYQTKMDKELLKRQNDAYVKELKFIVNSSNQLKKLRHDFVHHFDAIQKLIAKECWGELRQYLARIGAEINENEGFHTGNVIIDSGLNANTARLRHSQITLEHQIKIPEELVIELFDFNIIFGNLLDNAIEAVEQLEPERRQIKLKLTYESPALFLLISNPCRADVIMDGEYVETMNGLGFKNVHNAVERYPGSYAHFYIKEGWFHGEILLYQLRIEG